MRCVMGNRVLRSCHTQRRIGERSPANPSLGMTMTINERLYSLVGVISKEGCAGPRPLILLLVRQHERSYGMFCHDTAHMKGAFKNMSFPLFGPTDFLFLPPPFQIFCHRHLYMLSQKIILWSDYPSQVFVAPNKGVHSPKLPQIQQGQPWGVCSIRNLRQALTLLHMKKNTYELKPTPYCSNFKIEYTMYI